MTVRGVIELRCSIRHCFLDTRSLNPGVDFLWCEESARRRAMLNAGMIDETALEVPSVDTLLPLTGKRFLTLINVKMRVG